MKWIRHPGMLGFMGKISINLILELLQLWVLSGPKKQVPSKQEHTQAFSDCLCRENLMLTFFELWPKGSKIS